MILTVAVPEMHFHSFCIIMKDFFLLISIVLYHQKYFFRYHQYRVRPLGGLAFPMDCVPEPHNRFDRFAVAVRAPTTVPDAILNIDPRPNQYVRDIVGHVPRNICNIISVSLNVQRTLRNATCFIQGVCT